MDLEDQQRENEKKLYKMLREAGVWGDVRDIARAGDEGIISFEMQPDDGFNMGILIKDIGDLSFLTKAFAAILGEAPSHYTTEGQVHIVLTEEQAKDLMGLKAKVDDIMRFINTGGKVMLEPMELEHLYVGINVFRHDVELIKEKRETAIDELMDGVGFILLGRDLITQIDPTQRNASIKDQLQAEILHMREPLGKLVDEFVASREANPHGNIEALEMKLLNRMKGLVVREIENKRAEKGITGDNQVS